MKVWRDDSTASAARFLSAREAVEKRKRKRGRRPPVIGELDEPAEKPAPKTRAARRSIDASVPEAWRFVERHVPGAHAAWARDVDLPVEEFALGVTGRPSVAVATEVRCSASWFHDCTRCHRLVGDRWVRVAHRPLDRPNHSWPIQPWPCVDEHW